MIKNKSDLKYYLLCDEYARFGKRVTLLRKFRLGTMWRFQKCLRKLEYYSNTKHNVFRNLFRYYYKWRLKALGMKLGWSIPINVFGPGLCIVHPGTVIVNGGVQAGKNCRIHAGVNIGANGGGNTDTPTLGDNVYIGPGAKLFGKITIGDYCVIGANAVVNKSFHQNGVTIGGIPAKIISFNNSSRFIKS